MTAFDYAVLAVIAASVLLGLWRGVVSEILALAAWVVAFFVARAEALEVAGWLAGRIAEPGMRLAAAYVLVFVGVLLVFALARMLISLMLKAVGWVCWTVCWAELLAFARDSGGAGGGAGGGDDALAQVDGGAMQCWRRRWRRW
jgi:hypothetical protein